MKILYIAGESANWAINLCNELCKLGNEITVITQSMDEYDKDNPIKEHENLKRINLSYKDFLNPQVLHNKTLPFLENEKFDLIFGSHAPVCPVVVTLSKRFNIPCGVMILDIPSDLIYAQRQRAAQWEYWLNFLTKADIVIFNTHVARDEYNKMTDTSLDDSHVITYGINIRPKEEIEDKYVISVCRLSDMKNCKIIPKALALTKNKFMYVAVGRDNGELTLIKELCKTNNIELEHHTNVSEKKKFELISNASMLIYPQNSEYIGGLSPFEGMVANIPTVVPNLKVYKDLYKEHAYYFKNNDEEDLSKVIDKITDEERKINNKIELANKYAKEESSFKTMAIRLNKKIKDIKGEKI